MVLVYAAGRRLAGRLAGLGAVLLALANPLLTTLWTRALAESILAFFSLLALTIALWVLPRLPYARVRPWLPIGLGASLALAASTKLSGGIAAIGLAGFALIQQALALARTGRTAGFRSWLDAGLVAMVVFVAVNPLLYPSPVPRTLAMIEHRFDEMEAQQDLFESQAVPDGLGNRASRLARRVFVTNATPPGPLPFSPDAILVSVGLAALVVSAVRDLRAGRAGPALLFLWWIASFYAVVTASLGFDSAHYYAPLVMANAICSGVAIGPSIRASAKAVATLRMRRRAGQKTQIPAT
jgi:4-amino-4-deoxy-L-arabinose transferase-like glycosyltransferase